MRKIAFYLKKYSLGKPASIVLLYTCVNGRLKYYTRERIMPENWPDNVGRGTRAQLERIRSIIEIMEVDSKIKNEGITVESLKSALDKVIKKDYARVGVKGNYFDLMSAAVDAMEVGKILTPSSKRYSDGSIKTLRFTIKFLKRFDPKLSPENISIETYKRFIGYCHSLNYSTNYIGSQIKNWKALGRIVGGTSIYDEKSFRKIKEDTMAVFLDEDELELMYQHKLAIEKHQHARDMFILGCYTGLRVSDLKLLTKKNIDDNFIYIANEKTDITVVIPAHPIVKEILAKYNGFPPLVHETDINEIIKKVARDAGITKLSLTSITKGGKRVDMYKQKWELITLHTARRSMVTNLRKSGVPDSIVMKLCGITSAQTLKKYDKLSADEAAKIAAGLKFFK